MNLVTFTRTNPTPAITKFTHRYSSMVSNIATLWCGQHKISLCSELLPNQELWGNALCTATKFFSKSLLPEMVGKCYTRPGCKVQAHINTPPLTCYEDKVEGPWCSVNDMWKEAYHLGVTMMHAR